VELADSYLGWGVLIYVALLQTVNFYRRSAAERTMREVSAFLRGMKDVESLMGEKLDEHRHRPWPHLPNDETHSEGKRPKA
jgi:hypothetical protein